MSIAAFYASIAALYVAVPAPLYTGTPPLRTPLRQRHYLLFLSINTYSDRSSSFLSFGCLSGLFLAAVCHRASSRRHSTLDDERCNDLLIFDLLESAVAESTNSLRFIDVGYAKDAQGKPLHYTLPSLRIFLLLNAAFLGTPFISASREPLVRLIIFML